MAPRLGINRSNGPVEEQNAMEDKERMQEGNSMTTIQKLMLCSQLLGTESICNFELIYTVPTLQMLGMPMNLVSLVGLFGGMSGTLFLPVFGWIVDRGSNPLRRKAIGVIGATLLFLCGICCVVVATGLHIVDLTECTDHANLSLNDSLAENTSNDDSGRNDVTSEGGLVDVRPELHNASNLDPLDTNRNAASEIPFKAVLGMLGFIVIDIAYDCTNSLGKSYTLACCPEKEQTSMLVIGLSMASAGGTATAFLAVLDLPSILGLQHLKGANTAIQSCILCVIIFFFVIAGVAVSLTTGARQHRRNREHSLKLEAARKSQRSPALPKRRKDILTRSLLVETLESSIRSVGGYRSHFEEALTVLDDDLILSTEQTPLIVEEVDPSSDESSPRASEISVSVSSYGANRSTSVRLNKSQNVDESIRNSTKENSVAKSEETSDRASSMPRRFKLKVAFLALSTFFIAGVTQACLITLSDVLGKAVYNGDPDAAPGSDSLARYQNGVSLSAWGFLVVAICYLLFNTVHGRLLAVLGYRLEFLTIQVIMASSAIAMALSLRVEVFFALCVVIAIHRACFCTLPYAVINDIIKKTAKSTEEAKAKLGLAMSLVSASLPLSYCTMFPWVGPMEDLWGATTPLYFSAILAILSAAAFFCMSQI